MSDTDTGDLQRRLAALDPGRRRLLMDLLRSRAPEASDPADGSTARGNERLVGFVVPAAGDELSMDAVRAYLQARLPEHMLPQRLVSLQVLPRTSAGKLDRAALAALAPQPVAIPRVEPAAQASSAPDETTEILCRIWAEVLGLSEVGPHEDFFEVGGDSLTSIRILARANQEGLNISAEQFFALPTVAQQAAAAGSRGRARTDTGAVIGKVPLLPIQHWFHDNVRVDPHHWNQSLLFELRQPVSVSALESAVQALLIHHDALRLQPGAPGADEQCIVEPAVAVPVTAVAIGAGSSQERKARIRELAVAQNASLDLERAPLLRFVLFEGGGNSVQQLLVVAHHFLVDNVSWRILTEDLDTALAAAEANRPVRLPAKSSSMQQWSLRLVEHAGSAQVRAELDHWRGCAELPALLPGTRGDPGETGALGDLQIHDSDLDVSQTAALVRELPVRLRARTHEIVLCAFAAALARWCGSRRLRFDQEGHGREALFDDLDVSRTVGWLTCVYPLRLDLPPQDTPVERVLSAVRDQLRAVPGGGIGFGLLRHLCSDAAVRDELRDHARSQVLFNYMGKVDDLAPQAGRLDLRDSTFGIPRSERAARPYMLEVNAFLDRDRLRLQWIHNPDRHDALSIGELARAFSDEMERLLRSEDAAPLAPTDFPLADLAQDDFDQLSDVLKSIDDTP